MFFLFNNADFTLKYCNMEKYYQSYNISYEKFTPDWFDADNQKVVDKFLFENSESMIIFIENYFAQFNLSKQSLYGKKVLVTGCGFGGLCHYFAKHGAEVVGIDVSPLAIMGAKEIAKNKEMYIDYIAADLCSIEKLNQQFDFIVDDHLLHCLTTTQDRKHYLDLMKNSLAKDGIFLLETMVFHGRIQTPIGFYFDEDNVLWQELENSNEVMIRKIAPSIEIEQEVIASGLKINYLYYHAELAFQVFPGFNDYPFEYLPRTVRLAMSI